MKFRKTAAVNPQPDTSREEVRAVRHRRIVAIADQDPCRNVDLR